MILFNLEDTEKTSGGKTEVFFTTEEGPNDVPRAGMMRPIVISASADSVTSTMSGVSETFSDDEDFCIIDDPGIGIAVSFYGFIISTTHLMCSYSKIFYWWMT